MSSKSSPGLDSIPKSQPAHMHFIKLHTENGFDMYVNVDHIIDIIQVHDVLYIDTTGTSSRIRIKESIDDLKFLFSEIESHPDIPFVSL